MPSVYYVQASIAPDGVSAACSYFLDYEATQPAPAGALVIPYGSNACQIGQAQGSALTLLGASFKTLGTPPVMTDANFSAADEQNTVSVSMPTTKVVSKGVVLLFSNSGAVASLYASADPVVENGER